MGEPERKEQAAEPAKATCGAEHANGNGETSVCVLDLNHGGRMHEAADGFRWLGRSSRGRWRR